MMWVGNPHPNPNQFYQAVIEDCKANGQFDVTTMGIHIRICICIHMSMYFMRTPDPNLTLTASPSLTLTLSLTLTPAWTLTR